MASPAIQIFSRDDILAHLPQLADILHSCVTGGASVSFMLPYNHEQASAFWRGVADSVGREERTVLVSTNAQGELTGTVQLITDQPDNQPHRADVAKLLVHQNARRCGDAGRLMQALENVARDKARRCWCWTRQPEAVRKPSISGRAGRKWGRSRAMP